MKKNTEATNDDATRPSHYLHGDKECIEVIKDVTGDKYSGYLVGNIIKYLYRYKDKNGVEDLRKARQYLDWLIETEEKLKKEKQAQEELEYLEETYKYEKLFDDLVKFIKEDSITEWSEWYHCDAFVRCYNDDYYIEYVDDSDEHEDREVLGFYKDCDRLWGFEKDCPDYKKLIQTLEMIGLPYELCDSEGIRTIDEREE